MPCPASLDREAAAERLRRGASVICKPTMGAGCDGVRCIHSAEELGALDQDNCFLEEFVVGRVMSVSPEHARPVAAAEPFARDRGRLKDGISGLRRHLSNEELTGWIMGHHPCGRRARGHPPSGRRAMMEPVQLIARPEVLVKGLGVIA